MNHEYKIQIFDQNGTTGLFINDFISMDIHAVLNDSGYWKIKSKSKYDCPIPKGGGIIIYRDNRYLYSGILTKVVSKYDIITSGWMWEATGVGVIEYLKHRVIFPDKKTSYHETSYTRRYYEYIPEFGALSLAYDLIYYNLCNGVVENKRGGRLPFAFVNYLWDKDTEVPVKYYLRYNNLYDIVVELLKIANGRIIPVWRNDKLNFDIKNREDISDRIFISAESDQVESLTHTIQAPSCSRLVTSANIVTKHHYDPEEEGYEDLPTAKVEPVGPFWALWSDADISQKASEWGVIEKAVNFKIEDFKAFGGSQYEYDLTVQSLKNITSGEAKKYYDSLEGYKIELTGHPSNPQYNIHYELGDTIGIIFQDGTKMKTEIVGVEISVSYGKEKIIPETGTLVHGFNHGNKMSIKELQKKQEDKKQEEETLDVKGFNT